MTALRTIRAARPLRAAALAASCTAATLAAQTISAPPPAAGAKLYRIAGTLIDSVSGSPVAGATMALATSGTFQPLESTVTDADGHFSLDPMPAGKYSLQAVRRGYVSETFNEHEGLFSSAIVTGEGLDTGHIPFRIDPEAIIRGRVTDDAGEPVTDARVIIRRWTANGGLGEHMVPVISANVNDRGEFETWNLIPGKYMIAVKASPWFALHPPAGILQAAASEEEREARAALDVAYPVTYYDNTTDESAATPLTLASGEIAEVNLSLHAVPAVHITVRIAPGGDGYPVFPILRRPIFGEEETPESPQRRAGSQDALSFEYALAPGHYVVEGGRPLRSAEIDASGDADMNLASGTPTIQQTMKVRMADGSPIPKPLQLVLLSGEQLQQHINSQANEKAEVPFPSIPSGQWIAAPFSGTLALAVVGIQTGPALKTGSRIGITGKESDVTLIVAQGKTRILGFATRDGKGVAGVMVVLVPRNPSENLAEFRRDQSDSDGSFTLPNLIPGDYTIVAIEDGWGLEWARPQVIRKYLAAGVAFTMPATTAPEIKLTKPVPIQPR